ncbi:hypothetical protein [Aurantiacibacter spongiae]|uniref:Lipoprotein n=1 Tax=Aurantiacibacter spongiae TaxID=2488860 RepID=A0A3N5DN81_9SPHN|nr:hypothetical protein [Aurantiacibacter spongiae]RPF72385.1 hypothetical protein EG799_12670 [Aurantiacibacter spongiae]
MKPTALILASILAGCSGSDEASQANHAALAANETLSEFDLETTNEFAKGKFLVRAARQAAGQSLDIAYARCTEISGSSVGHDCTYSLENAPDEMLNAKVVQCHMAFYFDDCSEQSSAPTKFND